MRTPSEIMVENVLPARLSKGSLVGGYVVDGWLRDGGMASIYRARRVDDDRRVALKLQLSSMARDPDLRGGRFDREAEVMRRLGGSAYVVELLDSGTLEDGRRWLVVEWIDGEDLEELLDFMRDQDQRLELERACRIGLDVAQGLAELHAHEVVHLDLKPANVMVGRGADGRDAIKLIDFGIAAELEGSSAGEAMLGPVLGTSSYMAPELVARRRPSPSFDLYALGVLMFEALTGTCLPPDGWSPVTLPRVETLRPGIPTELAELVRSCMEVDPCRRPPSATAVAMALREIVDRLEANGRGARSSEESPVRTGGTELVLRASIIAMEGDEPPVRTGGTEVALTHEEVVPCAGRTPLVTAKPSGGRVETVGSRAVDDAEPSEERPRWWWQWAATGGVLVALGLGGVAWMHRDAREVSVREVSVEREIATGVVEKRDGVLDDESDEANAGGVEDGRGLIARKSSRGVSEQDDASSERAVEDAPKPSRGRGSARRSSRVRDEPRGKRNDPGACTQRRDAAEDAKRGRRWRQVLEETKDRHCWGTRVQRLERKALRVQAFAELNRFAECVQEGARSHDASIEDRVGLCKKELHK